jgi:hypothetical protein
VTGKRRSGVYQLHQPGLSLLLLPGYYVDRHWLSLDAGYQGQFPAQLLMTTGTMLVILGLMGVCLFRLLRNALGADGPAWCAAAVAATSFPSAAFAFQLYPEMPACLFTLLAVNYVCVRTDRGRDRSWAAVEAALLGVTTGMLTWLHPRFLILSVVLAVAVTWRTSGATRRAFVMTCGLVAFLLLGYNYHITGSWMPNALYAASGDDRQIVPGVILDNLIAYAFHGEWGLVPHAPWLLLVVPGLCVMARRRAAHAMFVVALALALGVPAAGHALNPAGGTPGRFVMAVVPLLMWPVATLVWQFRDSAFMRAGAIVATVLSLDASLAYTWSHEKAYGPMLDSARSGWKVNLAFPTLREYFAATPQPGIGVIIALVVAIAVASVIVWRRMGATWLQVGPPSARRVAVATAVVLVCTIAWASVATRAIGVWTRQEFMVKDVDARREIATAWGGVAQEQR